MATVSRKEAGQLCNARELQLVKHSLDRNVGGMTAARMKSLVDRARMLRDKFRDLAERQRREARGKGKPRGSTAATGNDRTARKAQLFTETLERLEAKLPRLDAGNTPSSPSTRKQRAEKKGARKVARNQGKRITRAAESQARSVDRPAAAKEAKKTSKKKTSKKKTAGKKASSKAQSASANEPAAAEQAKAGKSAPKSAMQAVHAPTLAAKASAQVPTGDAVSKQKRSAASKVSRERNLYAGTPLKRIRGHVGAQGRRKQARRDHR